MRVNQAPKETPETLVIGYEMLLLIYFVLTLTFLFICFFIRAFLFQGPRGPPGEIGTKVKNRNQCISLLWLVSSRYNEQKMSECIIYESVNEALLFIVFLQGDRGQTGPPGLDGAKVTIRLCMI